MTFRLLPADQALQAVAKALEQSTGLPREASCYLATVSAASLVNRLAGAGYLLVREQPDEPRLDV